MTNEGQGKEVFTGLLVTKDASKVVLKDATNKRIEVPAADVQLMAPQQKSLRPELLLRDLTAEQVARLDGLSELIEVSCSGVPLVGSTDWSGLFFLSAPIHGNAFRSTGKPAEQEYNTSREEISDGPMIRRLITVPFRPRLHRLRTQAGRLVWLARFVRRGRLQWLTHLVHDRSWQSDFWFQQR